MTRANDITLLRRAAELLEADARDLRQSHNVNPDRPDWRDEADAKAAHDEALILAIRLDVMARNIERASGQQHQEDDIEQARRLA